jgi:hypothetical protein
MQTDKEFYSRYGLPFEDCPKLGIEFLTGVETGRIASHYHAVPSMLIKYPNIDGTFSTFHRIRYTDLYAIRKLISKSMSGFQPKADSKKIMRYHQPSGEEPRLYFSNYLKWDLVVDNPDVPLILTEGEMKGNAACKYGIPTIPMGGVWNWASKTKEAIDDFKLIIWKNRKVIILFDSDVASNPKVKKALYSLCEYLTNQGAKVFHGGVWHEDLDLDPTIKLGIDDYLMKYGKESFNEFLKSSHIQSYDKAAKLHKFNSQFSYIRRKKYILEHKTNDMIKPSDFTNHYVSNQYMLIPKDPLDPKSKLVRKKVANEWIGWEQRSELEDITYAPEQPEIIDGKYFNYWKGWAVEPVEGDVSNWHRYMEHIFGPNNVDDRAYFEDWLCYQMQHAGEKLYTAVVFWSPENGSGKSILGTILGAIFGTKTPKTPWGNYAVIEDKDLKSDYNGHLAHTQFIMGDEIMASTGNIRKEADAIKRIITAEIHTVNEKYKPQYTTEVVANLFFTSNHPDAFYLDEHDRRFFIWRVRGGILDVHFATKILDPWCKSKEGAGALFHYFLNRKISKDFNPKGRARETEDRDMMIEAHKSAVEVWVSDLALAIQQGDEEWLEGNLKYLEETIKSDLLTGKDLFLICPEVGSGSTQTNVKLTTFSGKLASAKLPKLGEASNKNNQVSLGKEGRHRFYTVRNHEKWDRASPEEIRAYLEEQIKNGQCLLKEGFGSQFN